MNEVSIHDVLSVTLGPVNQYSDFSARTLYVRTNTGNVEVVLFTHADSSVLEIQEIEDEN